MDTDDKKYDKGIKQKTTERNVTSVVPENRGFKNYLFKKN